MTIALALQIKRCSHLVHELPGFLARRWKSHRPRTVRVGDESLDLLYQRSHVNDTIGSDDGDLGILTGGGQRSFESLFTAFLLDQGISSSFQPGPLALRFIFCFLGTVFRPLLLEFRREIRRFIFLASCTYVFR